MHPALQIEEIVPYIFEFLSGDPEGPQRRSLANLAVTCRAFLRPALEILWFDLPSLAPLVMCLPEEAWRKVEDLASGRPKLFLTRTPVAADWNRLQVFAPWVRLCRHLPQVADVDVKVFRALRAYKPDTPVLPNLRVLGWNTPKYTKRHLDLFLTANLLEFSSVKACPGMLAAVKQTCRGLRKLDIRTDYPMDPDFVSAVSDLVVHLPSLEVIHSPTPLTRAAVAHLSMLPNLKELQIPNDAADFLRAYQIDAPRPISSTLVILHTYAHDLSSVISLLAQSRPQQLKVLGLETQYTQACDTERLFVELANYCSHDAFESFSFWVRSSPLDQNTGPLKPLPANVLKHLFVFRRMSNLLLDLPFDLDDDVVEQMAASWPKMRQMVIHFPPEDPPKITLRGLVSVAKHCRDLMNLTFVLNVSARDLALLWGDVEDLRTSYRIQQLGLADAWVDSDVDPAQVGLFLHALFPNLTFVHVRSRRQLGVWNEINGYMNTARKTRRIHRY